MALFTVTNLNATGAGSLRAAVEAANASAGDDSITFASGLANGTISLGGNALTITGGLKIDGDIDFDGQADVTIDAGQSSRVIEADGSFGLYLNGLDLVNGVSSGDGGGIYASSLDFLFLRNSIIRDSIADGNGGGLWAKVNTIYMTNTTVSGNTAKLGGGIYTSSGTADIQNATFSGNTADYGGGLAVSGNVTALDTSTFTNNTADGEGGAIFGYDNSTMTLQNSIVSGNSASNFADIFADNAPGFLTAGHNVLGANVTVDTDQGGNIVTDTPGLAPLTNNGIGGQTHALLVSSAAFGTGDASILPNDFLDLNNNGIISEDVPLDANGGARVQGTLDIGAVEAGPFTSLVVDTLVDEDDGDYSVGDLSLREAIGLLAPDGTITFASSITDGTTAGVDDGVISISDATDISFALTQDITIDGDTDGDDKADITIDAGGVTRIFTVTGASTVVEINSLTLDGASTLGEGGIISAVGAGAVVVRNSTFTDGFATRGGAISADNLYVANTLFEGNNAGYVGGAVKVNDLGFFTNTTFSGNSTSYGGGAIYTSDGQLTIQNSTLTDNNVSNGAGGAIRNDLGQTTLTNSIVSGNSSSFGQTDVTSATLTAQHSILGLGTTLNNDLGGNLISDAPGLAALADNGGTTVTHALLSNSIAISAGNATVLPTDQFDLDNDLITSEVLPVDANGSARVEGTLDIGAVEFVPPTMVDTLVDEMDGNYGAGDLSLREALSLADEGDTIIFASAITGGNTAGVDDGRIVLSMGQLSITKSVTIDGDTDGDQAADIILDGDNATRVLSVVGTPGDDEVTLRSLDIANGSTSSAGGAIAASSIETLNIVNSTLRDSDSNAGGGIWFYGNSTSDALNIINSTVSNNSSSGYGGGLYFLGTLTGVGATITGNSGSSAGAAYAFSGSMLFENSTISGNSAAYAGGGISGGGVTLVNSILAGNTLTGGGYSFPGTEDATGNVTNSYSVVGTGLTAGTGSVQTSTPGLGALADNGGPVETMALQIGSAAIGIGNAADLNADTFDIDGNGNVIEALPLGADGAARISGAAGLDAGAVEALDEGGVPSVELRNASGVTVDTYLTIAEAIAAASDNFQIVVAATYTEGPETVTTTNTGLSFDLPSGQSVTVGFGNETATTLRSVGQGSVTFNGNTADNIFVSGAGADTFVGSGGDDMVMFSTSDARVEADLGLGTADSGFATGDILTGIEDLFGSAFNDLLRGNGNENDINGWQGVDNINGLGGDDVLSGESGDDLISGANGNDSIFGGTDNDQLFGNGDDDFILGGMGHDTAFGGIGDDFIDAGSENDSVLGQGNDDTILGDSGNDTLRGGSGNDSIEGGADNDSLFGNGNNDTIRGGEGNDSIQGNAGADRLFGDAGDDTLFSGTGGDRLDGGSGDDLMNGGGADNVRDVFVFMLGYDEDRINQFDQTGTDRLELDASLWDSANPTFTAQQAIDFYGTLNGNGTILTLDFGGGDVLEVQNSGGIDQTTFGSDVFLI